MRVYNAEQHIFELCEEVGEQIEYNQHQLDNLEEVESLHSLRKLKSSNVILRNLLVNIFFYLKHPSENA